MVSLDQRRSVAELSNSDRELSEFYRFIFNEAIEPSSASDIPHVNLLRAISKGDKKGFQDEILQLEKRRVSDDSVWQENDILIFMIMLGVYKFNLETDLVEHILDSRELKTNDEAKKVNHAFRTLSRKEYGLEGEYSFIKVVFLHLLGKLKLTNAAARQPYFTLTQPGFIEHLQPFHQVVAIRAYDLILLDRQPTIFENYADLVDGIRALHDKMRFGQLFRLLAALPAKLWISVISIVATLGLIVFAFGFGQRTATSWLNRPPPRNRPSFLATKRVIDLSMVNSRVLRELGTGLLSSRTPNEGKSFRVLEVESVDIPNATPSFSVMLSESSYPLLDGFAFLVRESAAGPILTLLPAYNTNEGLRTLVPETDPPMKIAFIVLVDVPANVQIPFTDDQFLIRSVP